jgi:hypothetical protein
MFSWRVCLHIHVHRWMVICLYALSVHLEITGLLAARSDPPHPETRVFNVSSCGQSCTVPFLFLIPRFRCSTIHSYTTIWNRVLLENLAVTEIVKKLTVFKENKLAHIMSQINPIHIIHTLTPYFLRIHFNITLPSTLRSSSWFFPSGF